MARKKTSTPSPPALRVVDENEPPAEPVEPMTLEEAIEKNDYLEILKAQRRLIAKSLVSAADNTRPQFSNELSKLNDRIREEEARVAVEKADDSVVAPLETHAWDGTGY